ncbi:hypothetical protein SAMN05421759_102636 [Roseivivax lentus]|uniref:Uncharacterized protein n=1 Tax=Roseivivax lentus TaxID=633194 RepID=A0A1N7LEK6_9RHOB|nr:hypothetical protein [Roseivivax lentus]SIS72255.1 hypothetical protein SAMN05421759_102636 [Roseivivax lentus]
MFKKSDMEAYSEAIDAYEKLADCMDALNVPLPKLFTEWRQGNFIPAGKWSRHKWRHYCRTREVIKPVEDLGINYIRAITETLEYRLVVATGDQGRFTIHNEEAEAVTPYDKFRSAYRLGLCRPLNPLVVAQLRHEHDLMYYVLRLHGHMVAELGEPTTGENPSHCFDPDLRHFWEQFGRFPFDVGIGGMASLDQAIAASDFLNSRTLFEVPQHYANTFPCDQRIVDEGEMPHEFLLKQMDETMFGSKGDLQ